MATAALQPVNNPVRVKNIVVFFVSLLCLGVPSVSGVFLSPRWGWCVVAISMVVYLLFLGKWICGRPLGILVNERNLMSLSRFQMAAWTILLLSSFFCVALKRLHVLNSNPSAASLNIAMNWRLWALMGISATSLVGTPLLLSPKTAQSADPKVVDRAAKALNEPAADIQENSQGKLYSNPSVSDAALSDMFQGDEVGDTAYVDLSKVQMFYFTVIGIIAYGYALYIAMGNIYPQEGFSMPTPPDALVALLGISHAAYLTSKTTPHS
ncbi:MAG: hypothetical protein JO356_07880 [Acidobacteria bacterium]|nr:hypothetical protein [Acidobacteriota bacterium]